MNKQELIRTVAQRSGLPVEDVDLAVNTTLSVITDALVAGERVQLVKFGVFEVREHSARRTLNPRTHKMMDVPASRAPAFRPGKPLKDAVSGKQN